MKKSNNLSLLKAYTLCILGGYFGLHRFYLRRFWSGGIYLLTLGFFTLGVVIDLFLLPRLVRNSEKMLIAEQSDSYTTLESIPQLHGAALSIDKLDPFQSMIPLLSTLRMINLCFWLFVIPYFSIIYFQDWIFTTIFALIIVSTISPGILPWLSEAPVIHLIFRGFYQGYQRLEIYYRYTLPPRFSIPILSTFLGFLTRRGRTEFKLFKGLASFGILFVILEWISLMYEYVNSYYPELGITSMLEVKFFMLIMSILFLLSSVLPVMRTLVYAKISQRQRSVRVIALISFLVLCKLITEPHVNYTQEDYLRYAERFKVSATFRQKIDRSIEEFVTQEVTLWRPRQGHHPHKAILSTNLQLSRPLGTILFDHTQSRNSQTKIHDLTLPYLDQATRRLLLFNQVGITFYPEQSRIWQSLIETKLLKAGVLPSEASVLNILLFSRNLNRRKRIPYKTALYTPDTMKRAAGRLRPVSYRGESLAQLKLEKSPPLNQTKAEAFKAVHLGLSDAVLKRLEEGTFLLIFDGFNQSEIHRPRLFKLLQATPTSGAPSPDQLEVLSWDDLNRIVRILEVKEMRRALLHTKKR